MNVLEALNWVVVNGNGYAKAYAVKAIEMWDKWPVDVQQTQIVYILSNMQYNHRAGVCEAKQALRSYGK